MIELVSFGSIIEVIVRITIIFFFAFIVIRIRGTKQLAQLTLFDVLIVIALGSAIIKNGKLREKNIKYYSEAIINNHQQIVQALPYSLFMILLSVLMSSST